MLVCRKHARCRVLAGAARRGAQEQLALDGDCGLPGACSQRDTAGRCSVWSTGPASVPDGDSDCGCAGRVRAEEYWLAQPGVETRIRASDHLFYPSQHLPRLEAAIRRLHALVCRTPYVYSTPGLVLPFSPSLYIYLRRLHALVCGTPYATDPETVAC